MGFIALKGVEVFAKIGVSAEERLISRKLLVDVRIRCPLSKAGHSDAFEDTFDYGIIAEVIHTQFRKEFRLMEAACRAIAVEILRQDKSIEQIEIRMQKLSPFIQGNVESSVVEWNYPEDW